MLNKDDLLPPPPPLYLNIIGINLSADTEHRLFVRRLNGSQSDACVEYSARGMLLCVREAAAGINHGSGQHGWRPALAAMVVEPTVFSVLYRILILEKYCDTLPLKTI